jgi:two-component system nitrate/nitrite response regulator NarL
VIRTLVVSDIRLYREGLADGLARDGRCEVVASAADVRAAVEEVHARHLDVVLLDLSLAGADAAVAAIRREDPPVKVVAVGVREVSSEVIALAEAGVAGYVTRDATLDQLIDVVESVARGEMVCSPRIAVLLLKRVAAVGAREPDRCDDGRLTRRENEIVALIDEGLSNKQIAQRLSIEVATVKNHVHSILGKLGVDQRWAAAAQVRRGRESRRTAYGDLAR